MDSISAPELVYPNAVYLHEGKSYLVRQLDVEAKLAKVEPCEVDYYTQPVLASACRFSEQVDERPHPGGRLIFTPRGCDLADHRLPQDQVLHDGDDGPERAGIARPDAADHGPGVAD